MTLKEAFIKGFTPLYKGWFGQKEEPTPEQLEQAWVEFTTKYDYSYLRDPCFPTLC